MEKLKGRKLVGGMLADADRIVQAIADAVDEQREQRDIALRDRRVQHAPEIDGKVLVNVGGHDMCQGMKTAIANALGIGQAVAGRVTQERLLTGSRGVRNLVDPHSGRTDLGDHGIELRPL